MLKLARCKLGYLYEVEERYWAIHARTQWLREGDRNTRYFYVRVLGRRKKNTIEKLKDVHGMWHDEKNEICDIAWNYFNDLFKSSVNPGDVYDLPFIPICVTDGMNRRLSREFTDEEILMAFNQMDPQKAPGIDGIFGSFFKDHWQTVGKYVLKLCHDILKGRNNVSCLNKTLLIMIPKVNELCVMANFRPISLYRVIYKIISKVLANRLKEVLPYCISHNQSVFAPGRMIHDNVLITHELMHYLRSSKNGPNKGNNRSEVETFLRILEMFEKMSSQRINLEKSMVCFSPSTPLAQRMTTSSLLKMRLVEMLDSYLGLSILVGKKKSGVFKNILDHIANRINRVIEEIQSMMHRVWWGGREQNRGWNILAWGRMCYPKGMGGLGFRDLWLFNVALLGRQVWRLIHCTDTLCYRVLSSKYFLDGDVFHPKSLDKPYFMWQNIAKATRVLYEGFDWNIGNKRNINIWTDNWGFEGLPSSSIRIKRRMAPENKVCELLNESKDGWNENRILELYGESLRDQICKLTILHNGHDDQRMWFHNPNGFFSSKSAYSWLILKQVGYGPHRFFRKFMWKLKTLPKIHIFCWRLGHEILPTFDKIASIRSHFNNMCPRCGNDKETIIHTLKDCPEAKAVLEYGGINNNLLVENYSRCID
ncbi:uncharacterized protein LOC108455176 [Gossypium arboreum]|uniref:uncharacterized protein LOC108455176 n=1 Tax=Gossypium arboreum TaxID=29729 RepID=UPI0008190B00|nr:uncharacterized protein LOC108455176 [Gossypium arboreum]